MSRIKPDRSKITLLNICSHISATNDIDKFQVKCCEHLWLHITSVISVDAENVPKSHQSKRFPALKSSAADKAASAGQTTSCRFSRLQPRIVNEPAVLWFCSPSVRWWEMRQSANNIKPSSRAHSSCHNFIRSRPEHCAGAKAKTNTGNFWLLLAAVSS